MTSEPEQDIELKKELEKIDWKKFIKCRFFFYCSVLGGSYGLAGCYKRIRTS